MKKKVVKGLALGAAGAIATTSVLSPTQLSVIADADGENIENSGEVSDGKNTGEEGGEIVKEPTDPVTIDDLGISVNFDYDYIEKDGVRYTQSNPTMSMGITSIREDISVTLVELAIKDTETVLYSYEGGNGETSIPSYTGELEFRIHMSEGSILYVPVSDYTEGACSNLVVDSSAPVLGEITFDGEVKTNGESSYYVSNGNVVLSATDEGVGINKDTWNIEGVSFSVTEDGTVSFNTESLPEGNNTLAVSVEDELGNKLETSISLYMFREEIQVVGVSSEGVYDAGDGKYFVGTSGLTINVSGTEETEDKIALYELLSEDGRIVSSSETGTLTVAESGSYSIRVTDVKGDVKTYQIPDLFSEYENGSIISDTTIPSLSFDSYSESDALIQNERGTFLTKDGNLIFSTSDGEGSGVNFDSIAVDGASSYSVDNGNILVDTSNLEEGEHTVKVSVLDNVGNSSEVSYTFYMYREAPSITGGTHSDLYSTGNGTYSAGSEATFTLKGVNNEKTTSIGLYKDSVLIEDLTGKDNFSITENGEYTVVVTGSIEDKITYNLTDLYSDILSNTFVFDTIAPALQDVEYDGNDVSIGDTVYYTEEGTISLSAEELGSGISRNNWSVKGVEGIEGKFTVADNGSSISIPTTALPEGESSLTIVVKDNVGNESSKSITVNMYRESSGLTGVSHGDVFIHNNTSYVTDSIDVEVAVTDESKVNKVELVKDGTVIGDITDSGKFTISESGKYTLRVTGLINEVNEFTLEDLFADLTSEVKFDTDAPTLSNVEFTGSMTTVDEVLYYVSDGNIIVSAKDADSGINPDTWSVEGFNSSQFTVGEDGNSISIPTELLEDGRTDLKVSVKDNLGNATDFTVSPYMHRTAPVVKGDSHSNLVKLINGVVYTRESFDFSVTSEDTEKIKSIQLLKDGNVVDENTTGEFTISESGEYVVRVIDIVENYVDYSLNTLFSDMDSTVVFDTESPVMKLNSFSGEHVTVDNTLYYTTNGIITLTFEDQLSGIDKSTWSITGVKGLEFEVSEDGNSVTINTKQLQDGEHELSATVRDNLGNPNTYDFSVFMHREFPEITGKTHSSVVSQDGTSYATGDVEVVLDGWDTYKVSKIEILRNNQIIDTVNDGTFAISNSGEYTVRVTDIVGNVKNYHLQDLFDDLYSNITIDESAPTSTITVDGEEVSDAWITGDGLLNVSLKDDIGLRSATVMVNGVRFNRDFQLDKDGNISVNLREDVERSVTGEYRVTVDVTDFAGNTSRVSSLIVKADFDAPKFDNLSASGDYVEDSKTGKVYLRGSLSINGTTSDIGSGVNKVELYKDGDVIATGERVQISESGTYTLRVTDNAGLYTEVTLNKVLGTDSNDIIVDNNAPALERVSGFTPDLEKEGVSWYAKSPILNYKITDDNIKSVSILVNGEEQVSQVSATGDYSIDTSGIEGTVIVQVVAEDRIGNATRDSFTFNVDTIAPSNLSGIIDKSYILKSGVAFFKEIPSVILSAEDTGIGIKEFRLSGDKEETSISGNFTLGNGSYYVEVVDDLSNSTGVLPLNSVIGLESNTFVVDGEAPSIDVSRRDGDYNNWYSEDVNYTINLADNVGIDTAQVKINGEVVDSFNTSEVNATTAVLNANTANVPQSATGMYEVQVEITDNAGNTNTWSEVIYADRNAPTVDRFVFTGDGHFEGAESGGSDRYGFFFNGSAYCDIYVSDRDISSGLNELVVTLENSNGETSTQTLDVSSGIARVNIPNNFKGYISAYATDNVGHQGNSNQPDGIVIEDSNCHINHTSVDITLPDTPYTDASGLPLYNSDFSASAILGCSMSGVRTIEWGINGDTLGTVNVDENGNLSGDSGNIEATDKNLVLNLSKALATSGNTNGMNLWVRMEDRVGHTSEASRMLSIDKDAPIISVSYNNTEADGFYNATRTATISVQERNFDPSQFTISGEYGSLGTWSNDGDTWTNTLTFSEDGDYQFSLGCTDRAGNVAEGYSSEEFTIDTTAPSMSVSWDNNSVQNELYYNSSRTATITVVEHNFDGSRVQLEGDGSISGWSSNGDTHTATITFSEDGEYEFSLSGMDLADNAMEGYQSGRFIIDQTAPELTVSGVQNSVSYKEDVGFDVSMSDQYIDTTRTSVELVGRRNGTIRVNGSVTQTDGTYSFANMPIDETYDDIYTLNAVVTDLAGNVSEQSIMFSVNRFGSQYIFLDASTLNNYLNEARDVVIDEINVDRLDMSKARVSVIRDGNEINVDEDLITIEESGGETDKYNYRYTIDKSAFDTDGRYLVQIFSHAIEGTDYSSVSEEYAFVLDTENPEIIVSGVETNHQYQDYERTVTVDVRDMTGVSEIEVLLNGEPVNLDRRNEIYSFVVSESNETQNIQVTVTDLAGNKSTMEVKDFLVTSNAWLFIVNQLWFRLGIAAVIAFLAAMIALIIKNRRDSKKEEDKAIKAHQELYRASNSSSSSLNTGRTGATTSSTGKDLVEDLEQAEVNSESITADADSDEGTTSNQDK